MRIAGSTLGFHGKSQVVHSTGGSSDHIGRYAASAKVGRIADFARLLHSEQVSAVFLESARCSVAAVSDVPRRMPMTLGDWKGRTVLSTWAWSRTGSSMALKPGLPAASISVSASRLEDLKICLATSSWIQLAASSCGSLLSRR